MPLRGHPVRGSRSGGSPGDRWAQSVRDWWRFRDGRGWRSGKKRSQLPPCTRSWSEARIRIQDGEYEIV